MKKGYLFAVLILAVGIATFVNRQYMSSLVIEVTPTAPPVAAPEPQPASPTAEPAAEPVTVDAVDVAPEEVAAVEATPEEADGEGTPAEGALNAETIVGTEWRVGMFVLAFKEGGVVIATMNGSETEGTWAIEGDTLSVTGGGNTVTATIVGDKLMAGNNPLPRIK